MTGNITLLIVVGAVMFAVLGGVTLLAHIYSLNNIKSRTVGDGQHGTARWATKREIRKTYRHIPFTPEQWREQAKNGKAPTTTDGEPIPQGIVVGCTGNTTAMVDTGDVHALMIGTAGVGKTAYWLYPCIEYACASGMSWLSTDTKGDILRNYGQIAKDYGYHVSVIDLRNPTRSNGNNLLHLVNKYMDLYQANPDKLVYKARCEKYAKIISKTIILSGMAASFGQNAYFYAAAEGLLTATILLVAEFCKPEQRHIVSVFKIIQELLAASRKKGKNQFQQLMELLPNDHKAKMVRRGRAQYRRTEYGKRYEYGAVKVQFLPRQRAGTDSLLRYGDRRGEVLQGEVGAVYHHAGRDGDLFHDLADHPAALPGNPRRCGRKRREAEKSLRVLLRRVRDAAEDRKRGDDVLGPGACRSYRSSSRSANWRKTTKKKARKSSSTTPC